MKSNIKIFTDNHLDLLKELISCQSITPVDADALPLIATHLKSIGFKSEMVSFGEGDDMVLNLYAHRTDGKGKNLCFAGHTDVVPPGDINKWSANPFEATVKEGTLYGRGAVDMKSSIICFIAAIEKYLSEKQDFGTISFLLTADEEGPAKYGTEPMISWLYDNQVKIDQCIVGEPVSINSIGDNIKIGARGSANFVLKINGRQGHVAYSHMVDNPVKKATQILNDLHNYDFTHHNLVFDKTNVEVTKLECDSGAENIVPQSVLMRFNFRYGDDYDYSKLQSIVEGIVRRYVPSDDYEIQSRTSGDAALWLQQDSNFISLAQGAIKSVIGTEPKISTYGGTSDARFIRKYCEVIEIGLIGDTAHQIDECVSLDDLETLSRIYYKIICECF